MPHAHRTCRGRKQALGATRARPKLFRKKKKSKKKVFRHSRAPPSSPNPGLRRPGPCSAAAAAVPARARARCAGTRTTPPAAVGAARAVRTAHREHSAAGGGADGGRSSVVDWLAGALFGVPKGPRAPASSWPASAVPGAGPAKTADRAPAPLDESISWTRLGGAEPAQT